MPRSDNTRTELCPGVRLRVPVVQASLGRCDGASLAAAVSRAGALGCLTVHEQTPDALRRQLRRIRQVTRRPVSLAFTAQWERDAVFDVCLEEGFRHFQVFWWNGTRVANYVRGRDASLFWQVGTVAQAEDARAEGADVLVAQGVEAGGPVRSPRPVRALVEALRETFGGDIPIVAGGGLADRRDVADVLAWGANAALLGTRFLLSEEAHAASRYKARLLRARPGDLVLDDRLVGDWPCAPRRRLKTASGEDVPELYAGLGLPRVRSLRPASEIVADLSPAAPPA